jgi:beta-N-acetylglucosaminidase
MRRKLVSSLLCMMMMCTVCTPAYADEAVTADTSVTTEVATTESTTATVTTTAAQKKVQKIDKKAKKTNTKKKKKKASKNSNKKDSSFVQEAPKKKITFVVKKTQGQLEKLVKEKRAAADQIKEKKSEKKEYQEKLQKIQNFYTQWNYGSYIGIQTSSDQSLDNLNDPADQTIKQLADNLNDTGLIQASMNYHFGLQDQKNILIMMDSQDSIDLQPIIEKKKESYQSSIQSIDQKIRDLKTSIQVADHSMKLIENKKSIVFDPMNLLKKSNLTKDKAKKILKGTALEDCSDYFIECEEKYGVNAIGVMAIAVHESAWGTSRRAQDDHNLTGYGVYSDSAKGINAPSKEENLLMTAKLLKESYLTRSGSHYKGTSLMAVNESYCTSGDWAINVTTHAYTLMDRL